MRRVFIVVLLVCGLLAAAPAITPTAPQPQSGTGVETGVYAPPLAGPSSAISGTIENPTGPGGFYVVTFNQDGEKKYYRGKTDARGKYLFTIPAAVTALMVFRHFDAHGNPDEGARCVVSSDPLAHVERTRAVLAAVTHTPAITGGNSVFEAGKTIALQTRGTDASARVLIDGAANEVDTLAASNRSVLGMIHTDAALGRRRIEVESRGKRSDPIPADLIRAQLTASGSHESGGTQTAVLAVTGLPQGEPAVAHFVVTGSAEIASGGSEATVPVVNGRAAVNVRNVRPGQAILRWNLEVNIAPFVPRATSSVAELTPPPTDKPTPTPYPYYTTSRPSPTPKPKVTKTPSPSNTDHTIAREKPTLPPEVFRTPGPRTTHRPTPPPTPPPTQTPYPTPTSSSTPTPPPCSYEMDDGYFEPTQGVWQDDPFFPNMPGKQLTRLHDMDPVPHFDAELDMIQGRDSVIFGVNHYMDRGVRVNVNSRKTISLTFLTNCTGMKAARLMFILEQGGRKKLITASGPIMIPIGKPRNADGKMRPFTFTMKVGDGIPADKVFSFIDGPYDIEAGFVTMSGDDTGLKVVVSGDAVVTHPPTLHFVPMIMYSGSTPPTYSTAPGSGVGNLIAETQLLRLESMAMIPDYYPIDAWSLPTLRERFWYVSWDAIKGNDFWWATKKITGFILSGFDSDQANIFAEQAVVGRFATAIGSTASFAAYVNGANRMVIVMRKSDYDLLMGSSQIASYNLGGKAVLMREGVNSDDVGHEVAHTIPPPNWPPDPECHFPYHNTGTTGVVADPYGTGTTANGYAAGERLRLNGRQKRIFTDGTIHIMGGSIGGVSKRVYKYTTQCTYWHLKKEMVEPPDPPVYLVRGAIARKGSKYAALLLPTYALTASSDLKAGSNGTWHIDVIDARGSTRASYGFTPVWNDENGKPRDDIPFAYRVPALAEATAIRLTGGGRTITLRLSEEPPAIRIEKPALTARAKASGQVMLRWQASVAAGYVPISSVFVSDDGGKTYQMEAIETQAQQTTIHFDRSKKHHRVKVVVSDYSRSTEATVDF